MKWHSIIYVNIFASSTYVFPLPIIFFFWINLPFTKMQQYILFVAPINLFKHKTPVSYYWANITHTFLKFYIMHHLLSSKQCNYLKPILTTKTQIEIKEKSTTSKHYKKLNLIRQHTSPNRKHNLFIFNVIQKLFSF